MKTGLRVAVLCLGLATLAQAIPNVVGGFIAANDSPLNDQDLTAIVLADGPWTGGEPLPGDWRDEAPIGEVQSAFLLARPKLFGLPALLVQATRRDGDLDSLAFTFADAGSYFGYYEPEHIEGLSQRDRKERLRQALADRQAAFAKFYADTLDSLQEALAGHSKARPRTNQLGKNRTLRTEVTDYRHGEFLLRLIAGENRLIRVLVTRGQEPPRSWLDSARAAMSDRSLASHYEQNVTTDEDGDTRIEIPVIPQGYKPYCGLNTLAMAARYFGLHLDEDQLAVAGKFQNTGSADGSQMPRLYLAVANEARLDMNKSNSFAPATARACLMAGLPVIVWRRFSPERDREHTRQTRSFPDDPPAPGSPESWPGDDAPLHGSVLVGYNDARREFLFRESWSRLDAPRRMHANELEATAYLTFYFKP